MSLSAIVLCLIFIGSWYLFTHRVDLPTVGGEYTEGLIGEPQFINPLYAPASDVDADLTYLVYSGLLKWDQNQGLINDLAETLEIFDEGKTYVIKIRDDARFHNREPVRARDVIFTIEAIKNPLYRSPLAAAFRNVTTTQIDDKTVELKLNEPFAPFLSNLTVGILPAEIWGEYPPKSAQLAAPNLEPIGSGPYRFEEFTKDKKGVIHSYTLKRNPDYYGDGPLLETITFKFYPNPASAVQALDNRNIEGLGYVPLDLLAEVSGDRSVNLNFPLITRQTVLFFNQKTNENLKNKEIRKALALAINKTLLVSDDLQGHGQTIDGPILPGFLGEHPELARTPHDLGIANSLLDEAKFAWPENSDFRVTEAPAADESENENENEASDHRLGFTLTTVNSYELTRVAESLKNQFADIGVDLTIDIIEPDELFSRVIQPRNYEILLTTLILGSDPDPYPFWHSSQINDNGLNLANYANRKVDTLLEEARVQTETEERAIRYQQFQDILAEDLPAVFLYQSSYHYAVASKIKNVSLERVINPSDRFQNIENWYSKTQKKLR
ncbi:peptide ABC transporter substrate-binding protein [Patescibacteria group bacterium]|nr:peptide ABC transporter substrate-binding protein [Patescibacteria group bacterium]MBU1705530.1 peptide ABC transporter substrate-binding protein [Patescibacteria group bacterium]